jgi:glycosyltransferase involved in cell wall biosynthesis
VGIVAEQLRRQVPGGIGTYARALLGALGGLARPGAPEAPAAGAASGAGPASGIGAASSAGAASGIEFSVVRSRSLSDHGPDPFPVRGPVLPSTLVTRLWDRGLLRVDGDADLLHSVSLAVPPSAVPVTAMVHDLAWRRWPEAYPQRGRVWHEASLRRLAARAASVAVPSSKVAGELAASGVGIGDDRIIVIPEGSDHLPPGDHAAAASLRRRLGVEGEWLLSVSTLEPRKNLSRLIEAYEIARTRLPEPLPLVVVGPHGWGPGLRAAPGVVLAGRVSDAVLRALYEGARALCYVPLDEGFGLPVVEAMAAGAPVLASLAVPSATGAALQVDATDVAAIAEGIVVVTTDEAERTRLVGLGRENAARHTWAEAARAHARWWTEVAGG